jgi:hypothetical protein
MLKILKKSQILITANSHLKYTEEKYYLKFIKGRLDGFYILVV